MISLDEYQVMRKKIDRIMRKRDQATGALNQILERLKKEFDCDSLEAAQKKLKTLKRDLHAKEQEFSQLFSTFKETHGTQIEKISTRSK